MRDYGKVHTSYWSSLSIRSMPEDGRTLAMYLLTCPHGTIAGVFRLPDGYACEDLQWDAERVQKGFIELFRNGFANRCETTKWVVIYKHFEWNPPENPNQKKAASKVASQIPDDCSWKPDFIRDHGDFLGLIQHQKSNPSETLSKPFLNQEQEQEQNKDIDAPPEGVAGVREKQNSFQASSWLTDRGVDRKHVAEWLKVRKTKKLANSETAFELVESEAKTANLELNDVVRICVQNSWGSFKTSWLANAQKSSASTQSFFEGAI